MCDFILYSPYRGGKETASKNSEKTGVISEFFTQSLPVKSVEDKVISRIYGRGKGYVFTPKRFLDLGSRDSVDQALSSLLEKETIRRLARGLYDYPVQDEVFGLIAPSPDLVAKALVTEEGARLQPTGAYAANILGLSDQIPAKFEYLTDLDDRTIQIDKRTITLKRTTPRNMAMAGRISGLITQAFRYLTKEQITPEMISQLARKLSDQEKKVLQKDLKYPSGWIAKYFRILMNPEITS